MSIENTDYTIIGHHDMLPHEEFFEPFAKRNANKKIGKKRLGSTFVEYKKGYTTLKSIQVINLEFKFYIPAPRYMDGSDTGYIDYNSKEYRIAAILSAGDCCEDIDFDRYHQALTEFIKNNDLDLIFYCEIK